MEQFTKEQLEAILDEITIFKIELAEDPTLPTLGTRYLQKVLANCRQYLNRVSYYMMQVRRFEKQLKNEVKQRELDLEFKIQSKLADDEIVRRQPSIDDRKAVAASLLQEEYKLLGEARVRLQDTEETTKLIKMKLDELRQTNTDIKIQKQLVRDDKITQMQGGDGYDRPQINRDRTIPAGLPPPITTAVLGPEDILDPNTRPDDLPEPVNATHAAMISDFLASHQAKAPEKSDSDGPSESEADTGIGRIPSFEDLLE